MSTSREKDQKDYDLEQIVGIIDQALASDDPRIKDALRALMTVTVLCTAEHSDQVLRNGPLARVFEDYHNLARRLSRLEDELNDVRMRMPPPTAAPYTPPSVVGPWIGSPATAPAGTWTGTDPTKSSPMWGPSWSSSSDLNDLPDIKKWTAGDNPNYKGSSASTQLAEDFLRSLQEKH
jgi:hypothetical protein